MRDDALIASQDECFVVLVVDNARRFFPPINVSRFQCPYVQVGVSINVLPKEFRPFICDEIMRAFMGRFTTLVPIRYEARISDYVQGASTNARDGFDASCYSFLNDGRGRSVNDAQAVGEDNNDVFCRYSVLGVDEVGHARRVNFNVIRVNDINAYANSRAAKDGQCTVGSGGEFVKYVRQARAASASALIDSQLTKDKDSIRPHYRALRLLFGERCQRIFRRVNPGHINQSNGK